MTRALDCRCDLICLELGPWSCRGPQIEGEAALQGTGEIQTRGYREEGQETGEGDGRDEDLGVGHKDWGRQKMRYKLEPRGAAPSPCIADAQTAELSKGWQGLNVKTKWGPCWSPTPLYPPL